MPISISALIGVGLTLALGCLTWPDGVRSLPTPVIMIIVTSLALGKGVPPVYWSGLILLPFFREVG